MEKKDFINNIEDIQNGLIINLKDNLYFKDLFAILTKYHVLSINEKERSLEDLFLKITSEN